MNLIYNLFIAILLNSCVIISSNFIIKLFFNPFNLFDNIIKTSIFVFTQIIISSLILGNLGLIKISSFIFLHFFILLFSIILWLKFKKKSDNIKSSFNNNPSYFFVIFPLGFIIVILISSLVTGLFLLPYEYDSLTYHLFFPLVWLKREVLQIIHTPFGDQAPAYSPLNGELFYMWLILPFKSDLFAKVGQFPFYILSAIILYQISVTILNIKKEYAVFSPFFFLISSSIFKQSITPNIDLIFTSTFLLTLYLGLRYIKEYQLRDFILYSISFGLFIGIKYISFLYALLLLFPLFFRTKDNFLKKIAILTSFTLFISGYWYIRNFLLTGSILYPASLKIFTITLMEGAYDRSAMLNSIFHLNKLSDLIKMIFLAFGSRFIILVIIPFIISIINSVRKGDLISSYIFLIPIVIILIYWFIIPYNSEYRFLFPAVGVSSLYFSYAIDNSKKLEKFFYLLYLIGIFWIIFGITPRFKIFNLGISEFGIVNKNLRTTIFALSIITSSLLYLILIIKFIPKKLFLFLTIFSIFIYWIINSYFICPYNKFLDYFFPNDKCLTVNINNRSWPPKEFFNGWLWIYNNTYENIIAYSGNNAPYYLFGKDLKNDVIYVNINKNTDWLFHDYDLYERKKENFLKPKTPKPVYERCEKDFTSWLNNLKLKKVEYLFITKLSGEELNSNWHNKDDFPIEEEWASSNNDFFNLVYNDNYVKIYKMVYEK